VCYRTVEWYYVLMLMVAAAIHWTTTCCVRRATPDAYRYSLAKSPPTCDALTLRHPWYPYLVKLTCDVLTLWPSTSDALTLWSVTPLPCEHRPVTPLPCDHRPLTPLPCDLWRPYLVKLTRDALTLWHRRLMALPYLTYVVSGSGVRLKWLDITQFNAGSWQLTSCDNCSQWLNATLTLFGGPLMLVSARMTITSATHHGIMQLCTNAILRIIGWLVRSKPSKHGLVSNEHSHRHEWESECPCTGSNKHEFACILVTAVHIDTSSVRSVRVACEFHSYEQFLCRSCFYPTRMEWTTQNLYLFFIQAMTHIWRHKLCHCWLLFIITDARLVKLLTM